MKTCSENDSEQRIEFDSESIFVHWNHLTFYDGEKLKTVIHQRISPETKWEIKNVYIFYH